MTGVSQGMIFQMTPLPSLEMLRSIFRAFDIMPRGCQAG
jgi:hypothetical protein